MHWHVCRRHAKVQRSHGFPAFRRSQGNVVPLLAFHAHISRALCRIRAVAVSSQPSKHSMLRKAAPSHNRASEVTNCWLPMQQALISRCFYNRHHMTCMQLRMLLRGWRPWSWPQQKPWQGLSSLWRSSTWRYACDPTSEEQSRFECKV